MDRAARRFLETRRSSPNRRQSRLNPPECLPQSRPITWAPLNPFSWVLLRSLQAFPPGRRPSHSELAANLCVGDASFLDQGWTECLDLGLATTDGADQSAEVTPEGRDALARGFVATGQPYRREGETLYFMFHRAEVIRWGKHFSVIEESPTAKPKWAGAVTTALVAEAIAAQYEDRVQHIGERERIGDLSIDWETAKRVSISTGRSGPDGQVDRQP